jgi:hypothetical protein
MFPAVSDWTCHWYVHAQSGGTVLHYLSNACCPLLILIQSIFTAAAAPEPAEQLPSITPPTPLLAADRDTKYDLYMTQVDITVSYRI